MFFHPCRDVFQAAWDTCSYRWIIWSKWEIELCVISVEMVGEAMCLYDGTQWCSVCGEEEGSKNRALGNPSDQLMCFGYLPSPGHPERLTSEGTKGEDESFLSSVSSWLDVLCEWRCKLTTDCNFFYRQKLNKVAVDLVMEMWWFGSVDFSGERWKQRLIHTQVKRIVWFSPFSLCLSESGPMFTKNIR